MSKYAFMDCLDFFTHVKFDGKGGMIVGRCYSTKDQRWEYDLMMYDTRKIEKYLHAGEFVVTEPDAVAA